MFATGHAHCALPASKGVILAGLRPPAKPADIHGMSLLQRNNPAA
jgi:hypothetical protein